MGYERGSKMKTQSLNSDIISTLPENIIESILSLLPIRDALRTSVLSKKWQYSWCNMPKLVFSDNMVKASSNCRCRELKKYKLANAIFHVLWLHRGPTVIEFHCSVIELHMEDEFARIFSYLSRGNNVRKLIFYSDEFSYMLPISFFSLQRLEHLDLLNCTLEPPLTFNGFSRLKSMSFYEVTVSPQILQRFLSKCPLLEQIYLSEYDKEDYDIKAGENRFTFVDLFQYVPLIRSLSISAYYMKYLSTDGMPRKLSTSIKYLKHLFLEVCLMDQNELSSTLCILRSSPLLVKIKFKLLAQQTPTNFLDPQKHSDLKLDHLKILEIERFRNLPIEMKFVKLIMAKSRVLKKVKLKLHYSVYGDEELELLRDLVRQPLPRASPSAELIIKRP